MAGLVAGFLALNSAPWWTLTSPTNSRILSIQVSPFYLQIAATGISATTTLSTVLGGVTRVLLILCSIALLVGSFRPTSWWRPLTNWLALAGLAEVFFSLFLLIHAGQTGLLATYGANPPTTGTTTYPASVIGTDLTTYNSPSLAATFNLDFYLGILSITAIGATTLYKLLQERGILAAIIPGVKELFLTPPYRSVWLSTTDRDLNPLSQDPENTTDDALLESFGKIFKTVQPGGTVNIILPNWAMALAERIQKLFTWTGFTKEEAATIYRAPGTPEVQLRFKKPVAQAQSTVAEPVVSEPVTASALAQAVETESHPETPPRLTVVSTPDWTPTKTTRQERAMLRSAVALLSERQESIPYRELVNQVYMDLVEKKVDFDSARQIESTLLKHDGKELSLEQETDEQGTPVVKKWNLGDKALAKDHNKTPSILKKLSSHHPKVPPVVQMLKKWQRNPRYRPKHQEEDE